MYFGDWKLLFYWKGGLHIYTKDQIAFANQISILDYAQAVGLELTLDGREWHYHYRGIGGGIDQFVTWLHDVSWKDAMQRLLDYGRYDTPEQIPIPVGPIASKSVTKEKEATVPFVLPEKKESLPEPFCLPHQNP